MAIITAAELENHLGKTPLEQFIADPLRYSEAVAQSIDYAQSLAQSYFPELPPENAWIKGILLRIAAVSLFQRMGLSRMPEKYNLELKSALEDLSALQRGERRLENRTPVPRIILECGEKND